MTTPNLMTQIERLDRCDALRKRAQKVEHDGANMLNPLRRKAYRIEWQTIQKELSDLRAGLSAELEWQYRKSV